MENSLGSIAGSDALLSMYLAQLQTANPGTLCYLEHLDEPLDGHHFKYCFIAFGSSIHGYQFMRKVIVVDGTSLKGKHGGCLVFASAHDGNFQIFPLAFGIVDSEKDDSWEWFFQKLSIMIEDSAYLVFISDRHASIYTGLRRVRKQRQLCLCWKTEPTFYYIRYTPCSILFNIIVLICLQIDLSSFM